MRPNTWPHRPSLQREDCPCQPGAVHTWFLDGRASGLPENVERVLASLGKPTADIIAEADEPATEARLKEETEAARQLGIFGSLSFACGQEIFRGDDRLEDAVAFASAAA